MDFHHILLIQGIFMIRPVLHSIASASSGVLGKSAAALAYSIHIFRQRFCYKFFKKENCTCCGGHRTRTTNKNKTENGKQKQKHNGKNAEYAQIEFDF